MRRNGRFPSNGSAEPGECQREISATPITGPKEPTRLEAAQRSQTVVQFLYLKTVAMMREGGGRKQRNNHDGGQR